MSLGLGFNKVKFESTKLVNQPKFLNGKAMFFFFLVNKDQSYSRD
jgi:hypothetical protein